jgi:hypothetical protein
MSLPLGDLLDGFDTVVTVIDLTASLRRLAAALTASAGEEVRSVKKQLSGASGRARRRARN